MVTYLGGRGRGLLPPREAESKGAAKLVEKLIFEVKKIFFCTQEILNG
jgi:hypothetical protein